jgi:hypothetical protein
MADGSGRHDTYHNSGQAQIGVQGGDVHGDVVFERAPVAGDPPRSLQQQIDDLRVALIAAREAGSIDDGTLAEAASALEEARQHAGAAGEVDRGALVRALRRARGLVEEVAGLVAAIGAVIATVSGIR